MCKISWDSSGSTAQGYAFVAFDTPEAAALCIELLNNRTVNDSMIMVARPGNVGPAMEYLEPLSIEAQKAFRVYVGNIHPDFQENDIRAIVEAFGELKRFVLMKNEDGTHRGYGWAEYKDVITVNNAIMNLSSIDLGDMFIKASHALSEPSEIQAILDDAEEAAEQLTVTTVTENAPAQMTGHTKKGDDNQQQQPQQQNNPVSQPQPGAVATTTPTTTTTTTTTTVTTAVTTSSSVAPLSSILPVPVASTSHDDNDTTSMEVTKSLEEEKRIPMPNVDSGSNRGHGNTSSESAASKRFWLMKKLQERESSAQESTIVCLENMVYGHQLADDELKEDIQEECARFGQIRNFAMKLDAYNRSDPNALAKVFIEYTTVAAANRAVDALQGRFFDGRVVAAEITSRQAMNA